MFLNVYAKGCLGDSPRYNEAHPGESVLLLPDTKYPAIFPRKSKYVQIYWLCVHCLLSPSSLTYRISTLMSIVSRYKNLHFSTSLVPTGNQWDSRACWALEKLSKGVMT